MNFALVCLIQPNETFLSKNKTCFTSERLSVPVSSPFPFLKCVSNSFRQTVHVHRASVHQTAKLVAALLRVAGVTTGLAESNGSLPPGL